MLYLIFGNPRPWHGHYYCALALIPALLLQLLFFRVAQSDRTAGVSICAVALFSHLIKLHASAPALLNLGLLFAWGVRICLRGVPPGTKTFVQHSGCTAAYSKTIWTWVLCAPTTFAVAFDQHELPAGYPTVGVLLCAFALLIDAVEPDQTRGVYTRNPYVFSSTAICWGLYIIHPSWWTLPFPLAFSYMVLYAPGGFICAERARHFAANKDPSVKSYLRETSPFFPVPSAVYAYVMTKLEESA